MDTTIKFKPRPVSEVKKNDLPEPLSATDYVDKILHGDPSSSIEYTQQVPTSVQSMDACRTGWVVPFPTTLELTPEMDFKGCDEHDFIDPTGTDGIYKIDTRWSVSIPPRTQLRSVMPFSHIESETMSVLPSVIADRVHEDVQGEPRSDSSFVPIKVPVDVRERVHTSVEQACTQLILTDHAEPCVTSRGLTDSELQSVEKFTRATQIYPDWYENNRDIPFTSIR